MFAPTWTSILKWHRVLTATLTPILARFTSVGLLAPGFSPWRNDPGVLQLWIAQLVSHGFRAGKGRLGRGFAVPRLRRGSSGPQGAAS